MIFASLYTDNRVLRVCATSELEVLPSMTNAPLDVAYGPLCGYLLATMVLLLPPFILKK